MNEIIAKTILNKTKRRDPWFLDDYTVNPFSGCSFNCLYCYIRGSKYGQHMERKMSVKVNAPELLDKALRSRAKKGQHGIIVLSSATDPYLQLEKELGLTRRLLEIILHYRFPVHIITKSDLVLRDADLLKEIDNKAILPSDLTHLEKGAIVTFSFSSIEEKVSKIFEPGAVLPARRLKAMNHLSETGFLTGVSMMPLLPWISDTSEQMENMFQSFSVHGAQYIFPAHLNLYGNDLASSKVLVMNAIRKYYPELLPKYLKYFEKSDDMPAYYKTAFYEKMSGLRHKFGIRNRIIA